MLSNVLHDTLFQFKLDGIAAFKSGTPAIFAGLNPLEFLAQSSDLRIRFDRMLSRQETVVTSLKLSGLHTQDDLP